MNTQPNQPDTAIDKTLAALNAATPPEGLEKRIATRIAARLAAEPEPALPWPALPWHDRLTGPTPSATWWRGAATGAAFALLAVAAVLLLQHKTAPPNRVAVAAPAPTLASTPVSAPSSANPCARPAILRALRPVSPLSPAILLAEADTESAAPSHPAPVLPLTAQERALARLARTADPQQLAALSSEPKFKPDAENPAATTPPPAPPAPPDQPAANPANPDPAPAAAPEPSPASTPDPTPEPQSANPESTPVPESTPALN